MKAVVRRLARLENRFTPVEHDYLRDPRKRHRVTITNVGKQLSLETSSWLTPVAIFFLVLTPQRWRDLASVVPLLLSTTTVGAYQWEEQNNFGPLWTKFRLMAERMKRYRELFLLRAGPYGGPDDVTVAKLFVEFTENLIEGTWDGAELLLGEKRFAMFEAVPRVPVTDRNGVARVRIHALDNRPRAGFLLPERRKSWARGEFPSTGCQGCSGIDLRDHRRGSQSPFQAVGTSRRASQPRPS